MARKPNPAPPESKESGGLGEPASATDDWLFEDAPDPDPPMPRSARPVAPVASTTAPIPPSTPILAPIDPERPRGDLQRVASAVRKGWAVPEDVKSEAVRIARAVMVSKNSTNRDRLRAIATLKVLDNDSSDHSVSQQTNIVVGVASGFSHEPEFNPRKMTNEELAEALERYRTGGA